MPSGEIGSKPSASVTLLIWVNRLLWPTSNLIPPTVPHVYDPGAVYRAFLSAIVANGCVYGVLGFAIGWYRSRAGRSSRSS